MMRGLELLGAHAPQMAVAPSQVVRVSDVRRDLRKGELSARIDVLLDTLLLQAAEEGLGDSIFPTVGLGTHARHQMIPATEASPGVTAVSDALVRVDERSARAPLLDGDEDGIKDEFPLDGRRDGPPHDFA